jgi:hypothetical protein
LRRYKDGTFVTRGDQPEKAAMTAHWLFGESMRPEELAYLEKFDDRYDQVFMAEHRGKRYGFILGFDDDLADPDVLAGLKKAWPHLASANAKRDTLMQAAVIRFDGDSRGEHVSVWVPPVVGDDGSRDAHLALAVGADTAALRRLGAKRQVLAEGLLSPERLEALEAKGWHITDYSASPEKTCLTLRMNVPFGEPPAVHLTYD